jgi:four helix bundle protein
MLRIYPVILAVLRALRPVLAQIEHHDPDLARQMRRAMSSVALNTAEGMYSRGRNRAARYHTALGSMRETLACIEVAVAMGYAAELEPAIAGSIREILGTLVKLVRPRQ